MPAPDWNFTVTGLRTAIRRVTGNSFNPLDISWRGIRIGHIDTGVRLHPAFEPPAGHMPWLLLQEGVNYIEKGKTPIEPPHEKSGSLPSDPADFVSDLTAKTVDGHGTRTLSVLCANGSYRRKDKTSRVGLLPGLPVVPYRVTDTVLLVQKTVLKNTSKAIRHAVDNDCKIISMSLGFPFMVTKELGEAVDYAYSSGVIIVGAGGQFIDKVTYPGKFSRTIGVGGHTPQKKVWHKSNYSPANKKLIDVWAPSTEIVRANPQWQTQNRKYDGRDGEGTSYGTVHVAAAAALWLRFHGENKLNAHYPEPWQKIEAFRKVLRASAAPLVDDGSSYHVTKTGRLKIDTLLTEGLPKRHSLKNQPSAVKQTG